MPARATGAAVRMPTHAGRGPAREPHTHRRLCRSAHARPVRQLGLLTNPSIAAWRDSWHDLAASSSPAVPWGLQDSTSVVQLAVTVAGAAVQRPRGTHARRAAASLACAARPSLRRLAVRSLPLCAARRPNSAPRSAAALRLLRQLGDAPPRHSARRLGHPWLVKSIPPSRPAALSEVGGAIAVRHAARSGRAAAVRSTPD